MIKPRFLFPMAALLFTASIPLAANVDLLSTQSFQHTSATRALLLDIDKRGNQLIAVGEFGTIITSSNAGDTWQQSKTPASVTLTALKQINGHEAIAVGHDGLILRSEDQGKSWRKILDGDAINKLNLAYTQKRLKQMRNSASNTDQNEQLQFDIEELEYSLEIIQDDIQQGPSAPLLDIAFTKTLQGFAIGAYGLLLETKDEGLNWEIISGRLPNPEGLHLNAIAISSTGVITIVGEGGTVFRSMDEGLNWTNQSVPYDGSLFGVIESYTGEQSVLLTFGLRGHVFRSIDQGTTWQALSTDTTNTLTSGTFLPDGRVVICGNSGVILTSDPLITQLKTHKRDDGLASSSVVYTTPENLILVGRNGVKNLALETLN